MIALLVLGCSRGPTPVVVVAASSLTEAFGDLEQAFEAQNPGVDVQLSFAGSQTLATQIHHGLPADVFASADLEHLSGLQAEGRVGEPRAFAGNALVVAVREGHEPVAIASLPHAGSLVVGVPEVPVGRYTIALLDAATARYGDPWRDAVERAVVSREGNVRLVLAKVAAGEADAAVVYATDAAAVPGVVGSPVPADLAPSIRYHHARLTDSPQPELAARWLAFVEGPEGQRLLAARGFLGGE
ncbi:MAG: molybdate ABC transporter substrate-binding protein [Alphaproteobacteria bacterium]|nr:molybdate ABC transporter substrate-binding protein [Alphaproteobacteria bacterium]